MLKVEVEKRFKNLNLDLKLDIKEGEFISIYGNSGSGKTTLLNILAGLIKPDSGNINLGEEIWFDKNNRIDLKPQKRDIGYLFQEHRVFPNMSVRQNLEFVAGNKKSCIDDIEELLNITGLKNHENINAKKLSGGQKQRLALARAIVRRPKVFLLDEPLSSLDFEIKSMINAKIKEIHNIYKPTIIMVSHSIRDILKVSDIIYFMENGKIKGEKRVEDIKIGDDKKFLNCEIRENVINSLNNII